MLMGWLTPIELTDSAAITYMPALCDVPQAYLVRNDGAENEYYIIENRQQRGWDKELPGSGLLVFHVDYDKNIWEGHDGTPNDPYVKRYTIFPANNIANINRQSGWAYPYTVADNMGNDSIVNDKLTNTSLPAATLNNANANGEMLMSKPITQMSVDENGMASFVFMAGEASSIQHPLMELSEPCLLMDDAWYLPDGRRLSGKPTARGLYINKGKKVSVP